MKSLKQSLWEWDKEKCEIQHENKDGKKFVWAIQDSLTHSSTQLSGDKINIAGQEWMFLK